MPTNLPSKPHWEQVYSSKSTDAVSWYQPHAEQSLALIQATGVPLSAVVIDVGGGHPPWSMICWRCSFPISVCWTFPPPR